MGLIVYDYFSITGLNMTKSKFHVLSLKVNDWYCCICCNLARRYFIEVIKCYSYLHVITVYLSILSHAFLTNLLHHDRSWLEFWKYSLNFNTSFILIQRSYNSFCFYRFYIIRIAFLLKHAKVFGTFPVAFNGVLYQWLNCQYSSSLFVATMVHFP